MTTQRKDEMPTEIWAYFDDGNGALWHSPRPDQDQSAVKYIRSDLAPPVPDDVTVSREVLKGALKEMKEYEVVAHAKTITDEDKNYWEGRRIGFVISQRIIEEQLTTLDAVLEGN